MAFRHGRQAAITINSKDLSAFTDSVDLSLDVDTADTSTFGSTWKTSVVGLRGGKITLKGNYDPTATTGPAAVLQALVGADAVAVLFYPGGNVTGQRQQSFNAILTSYGESSAVGDKVTFSADMLVDGAVTPTVVGA